MPNILNKYAIRKFSVGTASLLIGATLVFGAGNVARADELDKITTQSDTNKDKSEAVDINELTNSGQTESNVTEEQPDNTSNQTTENKTAVSSVENTSEEKKALLRLVMKPQIILHLIVKKALHKIQVQHKIVKNKVKQLQMKR
ncbi:MSCRAMM family adhesin SdrC [Staphylococcus sp. NRL 21/187]|nr:MSCRAMM family adhesin SdrC [Staphylococcus sp. NRL 21/187]